MIESVRITVGRSGGLISSSQAKDFKKMIDRFPVSLSNGSNAEVEI